MAVKIRFTRIGKKHAPIYRIVAIDSRRKRDGKFLENLGTYNPKTKEIAQYNNDRVQYWISVGAIPTDSVLKLIRIKQKAAQVDAPKAEVSEKKVVKKAPKVASAEKKAAAPKKAKTTSKA